MVYFVNSPERLVPDALAGFARVHADLVLHDEAGGFLHARYPAPNRRVGIVSGGGSGHEPLHLGFIGTGMLDAVCPGRLMASPHNRQVLEASRAVARAEGVLHLVKNYTGDRINFGIAAERLAHEGIACARVLIDDDLASDSDESDAGRRGTGATVLVEKVLGAAADTGLGLRELAELGAELVGRCRSLAVASAAHTSPATGRPAFDVADGELEYGVGIHGERASRTVSRPPLDELVTEMTEALLASLGPAPGESVIALVNGLGGVTRLELYGVARELASRLDRHKLVLERILVGDFVTALDMRGFTLTLMRADTETVKWFDAPAHTPAWPR
ncbi:dihydroxyacetone kinase subunit DhaK [Streptomyces sp. TRM76323]|uniref:Dihydroxyacetone kinase subunit DhaK n=1 Tax=Streptomyces tamarix TaxID=3078565 RepID=A0ABU3QRP5_9ACTN|nr:dihydroxyacetone kinase subunit DhaK [Streptomyces tamarix]MDT9685445.1 dihydroxyacetone kinase subunit DhaK [Streptomyces tamarix]